MGQSARVFAVVGESGFCGDDEIQAVIECVYDCRLLFLEMMDAGLKNSGDWRLGLKKFLL